MLSQLRSLCVGETVSSGETNQVYSYVNVGSLDVIYRMFYLNTNNIINNCNFI